MFQDFLLRDNQVPSDLTVFLVLHLSGAGGGGGGEGGRERKRSSVISRCKCCLFVCIAEIKLNGQLQVSGLSYN